MALVRWNPNRKNVGSSIKYDDDAECFYDDYYFGGYSRPWYGRWNVPARSSGSFRVNLVNNDKEVVLTADLPGIEKEDLDITVTNDVVTIRGERKAEQTSEDECYYCQESTYGSFERSVPLPDKVVTGEASASLKNGVLTLTLPKAEPKGSVKIKVN